MELIPWVDTLIQEFPALLTCLKTNTFPTRFLANVLGLSDSLIADLPRYLTIWMGVYFACGIITLVLRFTRGQKSLCSASRQINNIILTWCCTIFVPLLILLTKGCIYVIKSIEPAQGNSDIFRFFGEALGSIFYALMALGGLFFTVWMPVSSAIRYLKVHHLGGIPHMVFDVGTGPFIMAVVLMSAFHSQRALYALVIPAIVMLLIIQRGGYIPEERNVKTAQDLKKQ